MVRELPSLFDGLAESPGESPAGYNTPCNNTNH